MLPFAADFRRLILALHSLLIAFGGSSPDGPKKLVEKPFPVNGHHPRPCEEIEPVDLAGLASPSVR